MMESVQDNVVALVKEHPAGIPLKKLVQYYQKKYHQNLTLSSLGVDSVTSLIASWDSELVIKGQMVIYNNSLHNNQDAERLPKGSKHRDRDAFLKEGSAPVFRDGFHAQLRETHGANMRAVEAAEGDEKGHSWRRRNLDPDMVNNLMEDLIRQIAEEGELVTKEKVISRVCQQMQIPSLEAGGIYPGMTPALKDLQYKIREVNMFIECAEAVSSICTLYELGRSLAGLKDKKQYEELNLGPLCKLPRIHRIFKIDSNTKDDDIQQIETVDILKLLNNFRKKSKGRVDLTEFMQHLADHYNCDSPYKLGIRINSIALCISTLNKVIHQERAFREEAQQLIERELQEETYERLRKIKKSILEPVQGVGSSYPTGNPELRKKYASMSAAELVLTVFRNAKEVFSTKMAWQIETFLQHVSGNALTNALFQLAICGGSLAVPQNLVPINKMSKTSDKINMEDKATTSLPSEAKLKQYIKDTLSSQNSTFELAHIASLEKKLIKHFQVKDFLSLEKGTFLEFLAKHTQLLQDTMGSVVFLGSVEGGFRPTRQDVFEFIKQCGSKTSNDPEELALIESALRVHYRVRDSRDLGYGALRVLADLVQRQRSLPGGGLCPVYYEAALFAKNNQLRVEGGCEAVGRLGEISKFQALECLLSCPLLEDLSEWSQWELIFKPSHGSLKEFIQRNTANTGLAALEVTPGLLLKLTSYTGDKHFSRAAMNLDPVGTAGHLVSMVVADGLVNTPTALLATHVQNSLASAVAKQDLSQDEDSVSCYSKVAIFLLECWTRIPTKICQALLQQVFLEPFSLVLGQSKSKRVLISVGQSDTRHLNCLHRLGIVLGITDWVKDYQKKLDPSQSPQMVPVEQAKSYSIDSSSSSLSRLNSSEDFEEDILDRSFAFSQQDSSLHQANGEMDIEPEEVEDGEELYELLPNGETSDVSSEAEEKSEMPDYTDSNAASWHTENAQNPQRSIIEDIRKSAFGIGIELNAECQRLMQVQQERQGRSLDRLATELYSKDTHFVLELIQNADDNTYPSEAGVIPALAFVVEKDCITILNNEMGFQEKNIRAICDVGRSTKGKHKYGYIGQKGIGFKSVFKISDCPEIHSNGFHLRFDKNSGPMGYILPHWAEADRPLDSQLGDIKQHSWTTKICLPLRSQSHQTRNLFHDVHPSLLLFLHRLRSITIYNRNEKRLVKMTRKDLNNNVLEVEHTDGTERWLVVKKTLHPKKIKEDVESTELALAFQLTNGDTESGTVWQPQKQPVFAFLPLRSFGFRFIVQGDFDIPSSREDVDRDSPWNQWLRSEIPHLFIQAMENYPEFSGLNGLYLYLHFIPLPDEVLDFFRPVAGQIIQLLKGKAFLPTINSDGKIVYKQPCKVAVCQDAVIRDVIGGDELERHLSLSYLHPRLSSAPLTSLLTHLGVRYLQGPDVSTVTTAMARELTRTEGICTDGGLRQLARLLVCNFRALEHGYGETESVLQTLRDLPIIPLADGRVVALSEEGVFFPVETQTKKSKDLIQTESLAALYKDINVVKPSLLSCLEPLESQQVQKLLRMLGVHDLEPQQLLDQHIYPTIQSNKWKSKPESVVVSYLVFIKEHSMSSHDYVHAAVPVLTNRGLLCPAEEKVHFSVDYDNIDLPTQLPGHDWIMLSSCYVKTDGDVTGWRELFSRLGVRDGLIIRKERVTLTAKELATSPWSVESRSWNKNPGESCELDDYPCEEFHALATAQLPDSVLLQQRLTLLEMLANNWDTGHHYSQFLRAQVVNSDGREVKSTKSSFYHYLCTLKWVPAFRPVEGEQQERNYLCPTSVYLNSPEVRSLLGTHVCYADLTPSDFSRAIGIRQNISVEAMINYLKEWCIKPTDKQELRQPDDVLEGADFTSTVQHIHNVYNYLYQNCPKATLKELFHHSPAVFIEYNRRDGNWCSGRFYHLKEACWCDPTGMFQRYKQLTHATNSSVLQPKILAPFYNPLEGMRDFFLNLLDADHSPKMNQYVGLLELICSSSPIPTAEMLQDVSVVYASLAQKCTVRRTGDQENNIQGILDDGYCSTLKGMVFDKKIFPTKDSWVTLARKPLIPDSKELEKVFKLCNICLLNLPPPEKKASQRNKSGNNVLREAEPSFNVEDRALFLQICGIRQLSMCVKSEPLTESLRPCPSMQAMVRTVVPYIQRFLCNHDELSGVYSELVKNNIKEKIKHLYFAQVGKLYIRYELDVSDNVMVEVKDVNCLLKDEKELYIQKDHLTAKLDICRELVKLFCTESSHRKELMHFLSFLVTSMDDSESLKQFLLKEDIGELPSEEEVWEVPEPTRDNNLEKVLSRSYSSHAPEELPRHAQEDGEETLQCWPPRAPLHSTGASRTAVHRDSTIVDKVMKMWPPPAGPDDREPGRDFVQTGNSESLNSSQPQKSFRPTDESNRHGVHPPQQNNTVVISKPRQQTETTKSSAESGEENPPKPPSVQPAEPDREQRKPNSLVVPEVTVASNTFHGSTATTQSLGPLNMDFPQWNSNAIMEELSPTCQIPTTVVLPGDLTDLEFIGKWGEELVYSFLCQWKSSSDPGRPAQVIWCNQSGESGRPFDFKLTFESTGGVTEEVYVEVKSTVKKEKSFIHMSANELDFALKEKQRYHIFRVYNAGDAQNVRLCRFRNLAQHLHTKNISLYLFL
ncbi:uncharacterized protein wu:fj29h11 isoform X2 [Takifugu flavidus]|uniref:uncharacterized protein wu:fj29h11 isoform X2 n=1 Tax=Takifugu flavidus TaxID=433684 RepID=UPI002544043D|nr:uncharacterized protein wu:fj29h11 isoform X2 [Takifugu flavidus]